MVVFALVNSQKGGGFFIASSKDAMGWQGIPQDLVQVLEDVRRKGEEVEELSMGLDADWFLRTNARHACKTQHNSPGVVSNVELFAQLAAQGGLNLQQYAIQCFTFVPDSTGYVTVMHKGDRSLTRGTRSASGAEAAHGVRHVTVGMNGSYVVILNSGVVWWKGVHPSLNQLLEEAEQRGRGVKTVSLSLVVADWFFIEFADGATKFVLPPQWHDAVNKHSSLSLSVRKQAPSMVTSFNATPSATRTTPSPHSAKAPTMVTSFNSTSPATRSTFGSHTSFSPFNSPHSSNPSPVYGQPPYSPNPYVPPYGGMQQYVPQQQFAPHNRQQPVQVTNVYNTYQEPEKKSDHSGTVQLIGGALKVAGALLPIFTGNNNNNNGSFF
ncbi:hypothetical protein EI94DRAFT_1697828 [Lactarius quietus]|nr:hypothetical protein EI94DRAFT_1697828 [Lactarius quietus]